MVPSCSCLLSLSKMKPAKTKSGVIDLRMLKPQKSVSKGKGKGGKGKGKGDVLAIPPHGMPTCSFWAFNMFMRDFRKSDELESMIMEAGNDKWHFMTESYLQIYEKLKENVDEGETKEHGEKEGFRAVTSDV